MRYSKLALGVAALTVFASAAIAQTPTVEFNIVLGSLGNNYTQTRTNTLTALSEDAPRRLTIDLADFGGSDFFYVQATTFFRILQTDTNVVLGISIVNTHVDLVGTGLRIYDRFTRDEATFNSDPRKNVNSHQFGTSTADGASNDALVDNSERSWQTGAPGGPLPVPAVVGKSVYRSPLNPDPEEPDAAYFLYSFALVVPKQVGVYNVNFGRVNSGLPANTDPRVKTNVLGNTPQGQPYQYELVINNAQIEVVPEPASMIALGSGLVGLLALRRRRSN